VRSDSVRVATGAQVEVAVRGSSSCHPVHWPSTLRRPADGRGLFGRRALGVELGLRKTAQPCAGANRTARFVGGADAARSESAAVRVVDLEVSRRSWRGGGRKRSVRLGRGNVLVWSVEEIAAERRSCSRISARRRRSPPRTRPGARRHRLGASTPVGTACAAVRAQQQQAVPPPASAPALSPPSAPCAGAVPVADAVPPLRAPRCNGPFSLLL